HAPRRDRAEEAGAQPPVVAARRPARRGERAPGREEREREGEQGRHAALRELAQRLAVGVVDLGAVALARRRPRLAPGPDLGIGVAEPPGPDAEQEMARRERRRPARDVEADDVRGPLEAEPERLRGELGRGGPRVLREEAERESGRERAAREAKRR